MANAKFTTRLKEAVRTLENDASLDLVRCSTGSLFSPIFRDGVYRWSKVMDSDGTLTAFRRVSAGEGAAPKLPIDLLLGVVIQSEDATSQTKPNPLGKAALGHIPSGIWVDIKGEGRRRLDRVMVVFALPKGAAPDRHAMFETARRNVENAALMMPDVETIVVPRGESASRIAEALKQKVRPFLKGRGRPKGDSQED